MFEFRLSISLKRYLRTKLLKNIIQYKGCETKDYKFQPLMNNCLLQTLCGPQGRAWGGGVLSLVVKEDWPIRGLEQFFFKFFICLKASWWRRPRRRREGGKTNGQKLLGGSATIRIGRENLCLPYAGFFLVVVVLKKLYPLASLMHIFHMFVDLKKL